MVGPLGPIDVVVVRRSDGYTYSLSLTSQKLISRAFPHANIVHNVFISPSAQADFERTQEPIWGQVASILTGISEQQIQQLGGYRVIDYMSKRVVREAPPLVA